MLFCHPPNNKSYVQLVYENPVISLDVVATSIAVAGLSKSNDLDGVNLIPFLIDERNEEPHRALYWRFWSQSAIREGKFKYLKFGNREFLFDVTSKEHETINLIGQYPKVAEKMKKDLLLWSTTLKNKELNLNGNTSEKEWFNYYFPK